MRYGQTSFAAEPIGNFQGNFNDAAVKADSFFQSFIRKAKRQIADEAIDEDKHMSAVHSRDAKLHHLYSTLQSKGGHKITIDLSSELNARMRTDHVFEDLVPQYLRDSQTIIRPRNFDCLKEAVNTYEKFCGKFSDYDLKYVRQLVTLCETSPSHNATETVIAKIQDACSH